MNTSKYTENILNAVASGFQTTNDICAAINANYASVQRTINNLVNDQRIVRHDVNLASKRGEKYRFSLGIRERWRLYSYSYTYLVIDFSDNFIIDTKNLSPIFSADIFDMYDIDFDILNTKSVYVQIRKDWNQLFNAIEKKCEFRLLLPLLIITKNMEVTSDLLKLILIFSKYSLPILYVENDLIDWILEPIECCIEKINDPTIELIYSEIQKRQPIVDELYASIVRLQSILNNPKNDEDIAKIKQEMKYTIEKYNAESISVKILSDTLGISQNTIAKYLHILLSAKRIEKNPNAFNVRWYLKKKN